MKKFSPRKGLLFGILMYAGALSAQLIPTPYQVKWQNPQQVCHIKHLDQIYLETDNTVVKEYLLQEFNNGGPLEIISSQKDAEIQLLRDSSLPKEGYTLEVTPQQLLIRAADDAGFLYATQTLRQLLKDTTPKDKTLPCVQIEDAPRLGYRALMLDSGRQYQQISTLKKYIDLLCMLKMNVFHWHLTEGLGWRIQIKQYPLLTRIGAFVGSGEEQHGYYTQEEIKDLVRYAQERGVTIIPEIDIPGHASAALTAYPSLCCFNEPIRIPARGYTEQIFCAGKASTLVFLKRVLDEVCALFPSEYIHIGGDEAPKKNWKRCPDCQQRMKEEGLKDCNELQLWLTSEIAKYLDKKGRKAICWGDVVYHPGYQLPDNLVVQWWNWIRHKDLALKEAERRHLPVICSTNFYTYLNFPLKAWRGYKAERCFDLYDVYTSNPSVRYLDHPSVMGMSASLWTDDELTEDLLDERLFPRIFALAEQMWHKGELLPFEDFFQLIKSKDIWFNEKGYHYGPALKAERYEKH